MGREREARVSYDGKSSRGRALLETDHLLFRGEFRLRIPFTEIVGLEVRGETLAIESAQGSVLFELGNNEAQAWRTKILNPPSRLDKLGVKEGDAVCVIGVDDATFRDELAARLGAPPRTRLARRMALIFLRADSVAELASLPRLRDALNPNGAIWVVSRKGKAATLKDTEVMAAAKRVGLVDTKVASFSPTHTALKLVIPRALRASPKRAATTRGS